MLIPVKLPLAINYASRVFSPKVKIVMFFLEEVELINTQFLDQMIESDTVVHYHIANHHESRRFGKEINWIYNASKVGFSPHEIQPLERIIARIASKEYSIADTFIISGIENMKARDVDEIVQFINDTKPVINFILLCKQNARTLKGRISSGARYIFRQLFRKVDKVYGCPIDLLDYFSKSAHQLTPNLLK